MEVWEQVGTEQVFEPFSTLGFRPFFDLLTSTALVSNIRYRSRHGTQYWLLAYVINHFDLEYAVERDGGTL